ncbi:MAG: urea carboxylase [Oxalicibacterium faecigallinarum]|uniref:urea carboxylase n=1 Tax=Oxalicibacterium faecigallinarum TaxID=573741 RepID=UPI002806AA2B|nr:urea carboxylase [Oxalicibacterium faecigallinarum]MDQ7970453.1 urea carboxylase [Oxalicibacterium faecigallinarum]
MFNTVLIANRGEIACRIARTLKKMNIRSVAVYSDADRNSLHVSAADVAVSLGGQTAAESYLRADLIIAAAKQTGAQAIIPGYGFLSENADFAARCEAEGIAFVGPTPQQMEQFGLKHAARELAEKAGVPLVPGSGLLPDLASAQARASEIGYPVMLKSTAGGGGIGLTRCNSEAELIAAFESVQRLGQSFFANAGVFVERFVANARHVEVQIFGDGRGNVIAIGERDCSLQRRNQKVVEETPAPGLSDELRRALLASAENLGRSVGYRSAGTVEYIFDSEKQAFYFLEVNTRLQVEHAITESVTGIDLVEWMIMTAAGNPPLLDRRIASKGASIEVRVYAENPLRNFAPSPGTLTEVFFPADIRVDGWVETGTEVSAHYDPMIAKLIVHGKDRDEAIAAMSRALDATRLSGIATNLDYLRQVVGSAGFKAGDVSTRYLDSFDYRPNVVEIIDAGTYTTVQDYPGRVGYWDIGVPPSGPMDDWAFRLANRIVGNQPHAAGIETTVLGPTLRFHCDTVIALTGAPTDATLDDAAIAFWMPINVKAGQVLKVGKATSGCRSYLAVRNGLDLPVYLGSRATFALGQFGGHAGRTLRPGDVLPVANPDLPATADLKPLYDPAPLPSGLVPDYGKTWEIGVLYGPHGAPDFFTHESIETFFASEWEVHYNSNRLGIRLNGPKPSWTRSDGGEAGLHPSNVHDCEYAIGSINFTGDMPVILTRDGPSLGGFVCAATIVKGELWKVGQVKPGDKIRFVEMSFDEALALEQRQDAFLQNMNAGLLKPPVFSKKRGEPILFEQAAQGEHPKTVFRQAGDKYILIEYGENILDLNLRFRIHALMEALKRDAHDGILELSPGVRSLQVRYDSRIIPQAALVKILADTDGDLSGIATMQVASRVVYLPMAYNDSATLDAVARYRQSVRDTAPWLPSNTEFIRRINGLDSENDVRDTIYETSYMVLGLGDVYLGAPCAVPVDPRHRLLTSKYNPARTYTAEGTVGIGGVYMCIYGMDSPGGYQLVGRTLPIWNKFMKNKAFIDGKPWLLRFFDQVRFYPVTEEELDALRNDFREGRSGVQIEEEIFDLGKYNAFLQRIEPEMEGFRARQQAAFDLEVARWASEADTAAAAMAAQRPVDAAELTGSVVSADITGNVWKLIAEAGATVKAGDPLLILEAMKMEFHISAPCDGIVKNFHCKPGMMINAGDPLVSIE